MDVARTALRKGAKEVNIMYYKGETAMGARKVEVEYAKIDGVKFNFYKNAVRIVDEGIIYADTIEKTNEDGRVVAENVLGSEKLFPTDSVIIAVSQGPRAVIVSTTTGINIDKKGLVETDELGRTTRAGVFSSGDVVTGAKTVVEAVRLSKTVAASIDEYIQGLK
jgi:glutamate synthase (NADPH/NADH) small chain